MSSRPDLYPRDGDANGWQDKAIEEIGEFLKAIGKFNRFGPQAVDHRTGKAYDNRADVLQEIGDIEHALRKYRECL